MRTDEHGAESYIIYNLGPAGDRANPREGAEREIKALLHDKPAVLGLSEAIGYLLPQIPGYLRLRDTSRPGRANIAAYVRRDLAVSKVRWLNCKMTWPRTEHSGVHPARSWLEFDCAGTQVLVGHQPPKLPASSGGAARTTLIQQEGISLLSRRMNPWRRSTWWLVPKAMRTAARRRPRLVMADFNRTRHESGPGPKMLADLISLPGRRALVIGERIDCAVLLNMAALSADYRATFAGVRLASDHKDAFVFRAVPLS